MVMYDIDCYDYTNETHYTVCKESNIEDDIEITMHYGKHEDDYLDKLLEDIGLNAEDIYTITYKELSTDDGSIYFDVLTKESVYIDYCIKPDEFYIDTDVDLGYLVERDNEKLVSYIEEYIGISQDTVDELLEDRKR